MIKIKVWLKVHWKLELTKQRVFVCRPYEEQCDGIKLGKKTCVN